MPAYNLLYETSQHVVLQTTTKLTQGHSQPPYGQFNLALHVGDHPSHVLHNRLQLLQLLKPFATQCIYWLNQTHSTYCGTAATVGLLPPNQDALLIDQSGQAAAIMTADCLPIVLLHPAYKTTVNIHAGWRGLLNGVVHSGYAALSARLPSGDAANITAVIGVAIGPKAFEVGSDVYIQFTDKYAGAHMAFAPSRPGHYMANLYQLAQVVLRQLGVHQIITSKACSFSDAHYYSYRRQPITGRMATVVAIKA